jgi:hypothetical protein
MEKEHYVLSEGEGNLYLLPVSFILQLVTQEVLVNIGHADRCGVQDNLLIREDALIAR